MNVAGSLGGEEHGRAADVVRRPQRPAGIRAEDLAVAGFVARKAGVLLVAM